MDEMQVVSTNQEQAAQDGGADEVADMDEEVADMDAEMENTD